VGDNKKNSRVLRQDGKLAPGMDGVDGLERDATNEEIADKDSTLETKLVYDEYDPTD
jgi:hypothetical protein